MLADRSVVYSRYFDFRLALGIPLALMANPGRCWPGGHASSGFSLLALFFLLRDRRPRTARIALVFALGLGTVLSLGRMMQGAHFLSHNLWTLLLDWTICLLCYRAILYRVPLSPRAELAVLKPLED